MYIVNMMRMLKSSMPVERLCKFGPSALSDAELLAIILRVGGENVNALMLASQILQRFEGLWGLRFCTVQQLRKVKYIGMAKAAKIIALNELSARMYCESEKSLKKISSPEAVYRLVKKDIIGVKREHLYLISLDSRHNFISKDLVSLGSITETLVSPREVFIHALKRDAVYIILCHNHPSNDYTPSKDDLELTNRIAQLGYEMGVPLLDHVIVCDNQFLSLRVTNAVIFGDKNREEVKK